MMGLRGLEHWRSRRKEKRRIAKFEAAQARYAGASIEEAFERVYANAEWGASPHGSRFWSGNGSHPEQAASYEAFVVGLIQRNRWIETIVDVGCGDFQVSRRILDQIDRPLDYIGLDVVRPLIVNHNERHAGSHRRFVVCDATKDPVPRADLGMIRQVLQHLSNAQAKSILDKAAQSFKAVIAVESLPRQPKAPNLDIGHGVTTRVALGSGIFIEEAPFGLTAAHQFDSPHTPTEIMRTSVVVFDRTVELVVPD